MIPTHCYRITCYGCAGCRACRCANCLHMRALVEPPADQLTTGVVPATHLDAPVSDVVWDCLAGDLDGETGAHDHARGDVCPGEDPGAPTNAATEGL